MTSKPISDEAMAVIKAGLEGVTPGPWAYGRPGQDGPYNIGLLFDAGNVLQAGRQEDGMMAIAATLAWSIKNVDDADYIARLDPQTVAALIARVEQAEARAGRAEALFDAVATSGESCVRMLAMANAENARLRSDWIALACRWEAISNNSKTPEPWLKCATELRAAMEGGE